MRRTWTAILAFLSLSLVLVGCGGAAGTSTGETDTTTTSVSEQEVEPEPDYRADFLGSWELISMSQDGEETSQEDLELLKSLDIVVRLDLNEDGTASLDMFSNAMNGTWEAKEQDVAIADLDGHPIDLTIVEGQLTMTEGASSMTFRHIDPSEEASPEDTETTSETESTEDVAE